MSKNNEKSEDISLEELQEKKTESKLGEVCGADTSNAIILKIQDRPDDMKLGQPLVVESDKYLYYCLINRLYYPPNPIAEHFANSPFTDLIPPSNIEGVRGKQFYGMADLNCLKVILPDKSEILEFITIPPVLSIGRVVTPEEINIIYQFSEHSNPIGNLRGTEFQIPIDFEQLVKKPFGIFGRTGMGKSILNKLLCLFILKQEVSQLLLFDMQGEYGIYSRADKSKGLKFYFQDKIQIYRLSELDKKEKGIDDAEPFFIYKDNITSGDIIASTSLNEPSINALLLIEGYMRAHPDIYDNLLDAINNFDPGDYEKIHPSSLQALRNRIIPFQRYDFLKERGDSEREDSLENVFSKLVEGKSIVIDFAKYGTNTHLYFFIANMITRRLYEKYTQREDEDQLPPLVIVLEEAHKFLMTQVIHHTVFDRIAREMRKFQLTLAFVDQRPSQIDDEVFSQIANSFVFHMNNDKDISRVTTSLPNPSSWKGIITGLLKRQCLIFGDAISVPTLIDVLDYNDDNNLRAILAQKQTITETLEKLEKEDMTKIFSKK